MKNIPLLLLAFLLAWIPCSAFSQSVRNNHVEAELVSEASAVVPGQPFWVGLKLKMEDGWHTYWRNPGDSGLETRIAWQLPEGFKAGAIQWPAPEALPASGLMSYGYEKETILLVQITPPENLKPGRSVTLAAKASWIVCRELCIPGSAQVKLSLPVRAQAGEPTAAAPAFEKIRAQWPQAQSPWKFQFQKQGNQVLFVATAQADAPSAQKARFFPFEQGKITPAAPQPLTAKGKGFTLALTPDPNAEGSMDFLPGVVVVETSAGKQAYEVSNSSSTPAPMASSLQEKAVEKSDKGGSVDVTLATAMVFAFIGGLILNLMPCVLPVLSLKVLSFAQQGGQNDRASSWRHGLAYSLGVLLSFWTLAGLLLLLRNAGEQLGWGFQMQSPVFVGFLCLLFTALGLNFLGVFEVGSSLVGVDNAAAQHGGLLGSLGTGVLATIAATPCTAPFMGSALGLAMSQPPIVAFGLFTSLGIGMASPYLLLARFPSLLQWMPRPGAWMVSLKQFLGFLLLGTVVYLLWVFGQQTGVDAVILMVTAFVLFGLAAWIYGHWVTPVRSFGTQVIAGLVALVLVAKGLWIGYHASQMAVVPSAASASASSSKSSIPWQAFSPERVAELRAQGKPIFVDFTAAWCLTCKVNELSTFSSSEVREAFERNGIVPLKADWTRKDEAITRQLTAFGRSGVPLYVFYPKGVESQPQILPEVITPAVVLKAIGQ